MTLLLKYYDGLADLPTGGGIPDEVIKMLEEKFRLPTEKELGDFESIEDAVSHMATQNLCFAMSKYGYSLAFEELSRLKEENERLRGALSELYDVVYKGENVFKSLDKAHEVLNKPNITIVQSTPSPTKK